MAVYTLFSQSGGGTLTTDNNTYTLGVQFSVSTGCTLTAIWFWTPTGATALAATIGLYQVTGVGTGTLIHSESASWSGSAGSNTWVRAAFSSPPSLTSSTNYKAVIFNSSGVSIYGKTDHYWDTGAGSGGITNGPLSAPNSAGGDGGQDTFNTGSPIAYPATEFNEANYWLDPEVTTTGTAGSVQPVTTIPVPRRRPSRAVIQFTPVATVNVGNGPAGKVQPITAQAAPRRKPARAYVRFTPVTTTNAPAKPKLPHGTAASDEARGWKRWLLWGS